MVTAKPPKLTKSDTEAKFQKEIVSWLRKQGCTVFKMTPGPGIPDATPDLLFLKDGFWGMLECKKHRTASFRPGQREAIAKYDEMSYAAVVYPENVEEIKKVLGEMLG